MKKIHWKSVLLGLFVGVALCLVVFFVIPFKHMSYYAFDSFLGRIVEIPASNSPLLCVGENYDGLNIASCSDLVIFQK